MKKIFLLLGVLICSNATFAQNVGIGITSPAAKLHVKGLSDATQLIIDANSTQSNSNPLIKLRNSSGTDLIWIHSDDTSNTFIGRNAGRINNAAGGGVWNSFTGCGAGYSNSTGNRNTANGMRALFSNTTGTYNTATGMDALYSNTIGSQNTANGSLALALNTAGYSNTANGYQALYSNTTGEDNTANGVNALYSNTTGIYNTALGVSALGTNVAGSYGVAIGYLSQGNANNISTGWDNSNTSVGFQSLRGSSSLANNTGTGNTAIGRDALYSNSSGYSNTANGSGALYANTTGFQNTSVGSNSLALNITGAYNTALGYNTGPNSGNLFNTTCLGIDATATGSDMVRIGNTYVGSIGGYQGWTTLPSDKRFKQNVREDVSGLNFIMRLIPITYTVDVNSINHFLGKKNNDTYETAEGGKSTMKKSSIRFSGFNAQDVEQAAKEAGYDFSGIDKPKNENDFYGLRYAEFVVPLVKAVQELADRNAKLAEQVSGQQKIIEDLSKGLQAEKNQNAELIKRIEALEKK